MSVIESIKKELNIVSTENGDVAYESTFNANLDFFGLSGALRHRQTEVKRLFEEAMDEDVKLALQNLFYLRDVRGGLGERDSFRTCLRIVIEKNPDVALLLIPYIVEYGRWDDLLVFLDYESVNKVAIAFIFEQLLDDVKNLEAGKGVSLCAKWMPSINASSAETRRQAIKICNITGMSKGDYRKLLSELRKDNVVERKLTEKDYSFDYSKLPAKALSKYIDAFNRNDRDRYLKYKDDLKTGKVTAKVKSLYAYDIVRNANRDKVLADQQWKALDRNEDDGNTIVVRDGSGSMYGLPDEIATSLSILFAEQLTGEFKDKFITFSMRPKLISIKGDTIAEKVNYVRRFDECANTDISKVYELIYNVSLQITDPKDYITRIVIISDMEFDYCGKNVPSYEVMKEKFEAAGIPLPEIVFWNVECRNTHFAAKADQPNIRLVSGASQYVIDSIINNKSCDAYDFMIKTLAKYEKDAKTILNIIANLQKKVLEEHSSQHKN